LLAKAEQGREESFFAPATWSGSMVLTTGPNLIICTIFPFHEGSAIWLDDMLEKVVDGNPWEGEVSFTGSNGDEHWTRIGVTPVYDEAGIEELVMTGSDVTGHHQAKRRIDTKKPRRDRTDHQPAKIPFGVDPWKDKRRNESE